MPMSLEVPVNRIAATRTDPLPVQRDGISNGSTADARVVCLHNEGTTWLNMTDAQRDQQIRQQLVRLKSRYVEQFKNIHALTTTYKWFSCMRTEGKNPEHTSLDKGWRYEFRNEFTKNCWRLILNLKMGHIDKKAIYMSNVVALQFEQAFNSNNWLLTLPQTIVQFRITNKKTNDVMLAHQANYQSQAFKNAFLHTTVNGKSTVRVTEDLGMTIDQLTVIFQDRPIVKTPHPVTAYTLDYAPFSVIFHVRPDPEIYG